MSYKSPAMSGVTGRTKSDGKYCFVDAHGDIDIFSEIGWSNVKVANVPHSDRKELQGMNLNCMLRGLFILYGFEDLNDEVLPGGFYCWEVLLESIFISITHFCTIDEILRRIQHLVFTFVHDGDAANSFEGDSNSVGNILYGSFSFLLYWILSFGSYLSDSDLTRLRAGIHGLGIQFNEQREETIKKNRYSYNYPEVLEKCRARYAELHKITHEVVQNRLFKAIGLTRNTATGGDVSVVHNNYAQPNVSQSVGTWAGYEVALNKEKLKATLASAPPMKLEIFGAEAFLDASDDEDDENTFGTGRRSGGSAGGMWGQDSAPEAVPPPTVRMPPKVSLLREPYALAADIFTIDPLELARQWTLSDHALFCSIPLHSLIPPPGKSEPIGIASRSQQARLGLLGKGTFGGALALADRFNAMCTWVTDSILKNTSLDSRVGRITYFIRLAAHMAELSNFNALHIIVAALQQNCIMRLKLSFEGVPKADKVKFNQLKNLMANLKNFQKYRLEVTKLSVHFDFADDISTFARSDTSKGSPRSQDGELVWKRDIMLRYKPHRSSQSTSQRALQSATVSHSLMRSNSMNNMMTTKSIALDNPDNIWSEHFEAIVPYLGAHCGDITTVCEGNGDYLTDRPYLFNTHKMALLAGPLSLLLKMQRLQYNLTPVRSIVAALHCSVKPHLRLSKAAANEMSKKLDKLSFAVEPEGMVNDFDNESHHGSVSSGPATGRVRGSGPQLAPGTPSGRAKYRKSGAYDRLTGKATSGRSGNIYEDESEAGTGQEGSEEEEEEESEEEETRPKNKSFFRKPIKLVRTFTKAFMSTGKSEK